MANIRDNAGLNISGSGFFSRETAEMKALRGLYQATDKYTKEGYYLFVLNTAKADGEPDQHLAAQGDMPRGMQFGYIFRGGGRVEDKARTVAHELGHGIFALEHTFDVNFAGDKLKAQTTNLMDYADGTVLGAFQWNYIAHPAPLTFFDNDKDAALIGFGNKAATRRVVETLRFGHAFNRSVKFDAATGLGADNIVLGDNNKYDAIVMKDISPAVSLNPRNDKSDFFVALNSTTSLRFGFTFEKQLGNRQQYKIELEAQTKNDQHIKLRNYVQCESETSWRQGIDNLLNLGGESLSNLNALPDEALMELSNAQRIKLLNKIIAAQGVYGLAARVMANVPKEHANGMFELLSKTQVFTSFKNLMGNEVYADFVRSALIAFYRQEGIKEILINIKHDRVFVWYKGYELNGSGDNIDYVFSMSGSASQIKGRVSKWVLAGPRGMQHPEYKGSVDLYDVTLNMCDMLALKVDTPLSGIGASGKIYPIPAFYFDWLNTNYKRQEAIDLIDMTITIGSLAVGIGELRLAAMAGRFIFTVKTAVSITKSAVDLVLLNEEIETRLKDSEQGQKFLIVWSKFSLLYDLATFDLKNAGKDRNYFNDLSTAYSTYRLFLKDDLGEKQFEQLNKFMTEIENNK